MKRSGRSSPSSLSRRALHEEVLSSISARRLRGRLPSDSLSRLYQMRSHHHRRLHGDWLPMQRKVVKNNIIRIRFSYTPWGEASVKAKQLFNVLENDSPGFQQIRHSGDTVEIHLDD